ncbi:MAG: DUF2877 domain-containing protein [Tissierellia bacterium]|nr:DUF2877 domain-containing protein [Tissierellia bacterium]
MQGLSYDYHFIDLFRRLKDGEEAGHIHSIFQRVVNFTDGEHNMFSVATKDIDNAPYTLRIDGVADFRDLVSEGDKLYRDGNRLMVGDGLSITIVENRLWIGNCIEKSKVDPMIIAKNIEYFNEMILNCSPMGGAKYSYLKNILGIDMIEGPSLIEKELSNRIERFLYGIYEYDIKVKDLNRLIGFGVGLTPSGDDFLVGFLSALNSIDTEYINNIFDGIVELIDIEDISTTDISKQMIRIAIDGQAREYISGFIRAFSEADRDGFIHSYRNILRIGSSSGMDISIGIAMAFHFILDTKNWRLEDEEDIG